jgi:hypothetical protein
MTINRPAVSELIPTAPQVPQNKKKNSINT